MELNSVELSADTDERHIVSEYQVFWNQPAGKRLLLLQFPSRNHDTPYNSATRMKPSEIRIKPLSGLLEIDVPIYANDRFDWERGRKFAQALKQSKTLQSGGQFGLAGGFGINSQARRIPGSQNGAELADGSREHSTLLTTLTLGGRLRVFKTGDPIYAVGVFKDDSLHLSKVDGICSLQPQFHHLDALADNDRVASRYAGGEHPAGESEARAVNMTVKSTDTEQIDISEVDRTLRAMQEESWQQLEWIDESDIRAFASYEADLSLSDAAQSTNLLSAITESQYLDALSAPRIDPTRQGKRVMISRPWGDDGAEGIIIEDGHASVETAGGRMAFDNAPSNSIKTKMEID